ncbi:tetratricopeptide repeat protein [Flavobacterium sp. CAU 1735]|uniref:tetratricopeptide repeat protein n=1 Tax=Flavobacterium sp. CAU 1735 TaxID=3140361 RepID=UPI0032611B3F
MKCYLFFLGFLGFLPLAYSQSKEAEFDNMFQKTLRLDAMASPEALIEGIKAITYAEQINYKPGIVKGTFWICEHYIQNGNDAQALLFAVKAEKSDAFSDVTNRVKLKRIKAKSLIRMGFYEEAEKTLNDALCYVIKLQENKHSCWLKGAIYADMGTNYAENEETQHRAIEYYQKSLQLFQKMDDSDQLKSQYTFWVLVKIASLYRRQRQLAKAQQYLKKATSYIDFLKNDMGKAEYFYNQGIVCNANDDIKKAKQYFQKALQIVKRECKITCKKELYYQLFKVCQNLNNKDSCRYYRQQYMLYSDSLHQMYKKDASVALRFFEEEKQYEIKERSFHYFLGVLFCMLIMLIGSSKLFRDHRKFKILKKEKIAIEEQLLKSESNLNLLKKKNSPLANTTIELDRLVREGSPVFLTEFKKQFPDFYDRLLLYNFDIEVDMKFCALMRLDYTTAQMADYTKSSIRAVESKKYRIRKKLDIPRDKNIYEWFQEF